jgi:hypothetical protein
MSRVIRTLVVLAWFASPLAYGQRMLSPTPPLGPMWEMQADGDAYQKDLGFILPEKWSDFAREGFSSGRADGGSVRGVYKSRDGALSMTIWIQLRIDMRGFPMPQDTVWSLLKAAFTAEAGPKPGNTGTELSSGPFAIGKRTPAGKQQWASYATDAGAKVQGAFWQNIGVWSVVVTFMGPEERRADLEKYSQALFNELPFPYAPLATELAVDGATLLAAMPKCDGERPEGSGKEFVPTFPQAALMSILLTGMMVGQENQFIISPVTHAGDYCVIETFNVRKDLPVTALEYRGKSTEAWEARYGFVLNHGQGGYYQVERMPAEAAKQTTTNGVTLDQVFLNFSNNKRGAIAAVFNDWPGYEEAKRAISALHKDGKADPIINVVQTAEKRHITQNPERVQKLAE